ncbi:MAG TPA: LamG-like jellyroll fold domain-containing protein [Pyrinomonadaceae bacterium]
MRIGFGLGLGVSGGRHMPPVQGDGDFNPIQFIADNAVAYWKFEEDSPPLTDTTGRGNSLDAPNGALFEQSGKLGNAIGYDGATTYLSRASTADLQIGGGDFVVAAWVKFAAVGDDHVIATKPAEYGLYLSLGGLYFTAGDGAGSALSSVTPSADVWYLIVGWYDRAHETFRIRVNNGTVDSNPQEDVVGTGGSADLYVGSNSGSANFFDGLIDDTLIIKTSTPMSSDDFDALCSYLWSGGNGLDLTFIF